MKNEGTKPIIREEAGVHDNKPAHLIPVTGTLSCPAIGTGNSEADPTFLTTTTECQIIHNAIRKLKARHEHIRRMRATPFFTFPFERSPAKLNSLEADRELTEAITEIRLLFETIRTSLCRLIRLTHSTDPADEAITRMITRAQSAAHAVRPWAGQSHILRLRLGNENAVRAQTQFHTVLPNASAAEVQEFVDAVDRGYLEYARQVVRRNLTAEDAAAQEGGTKTALGELVLEDIIVRGRQLLLLSREVARTTGLVRALDPAGGSPAAMLPTWIYLAGCCIVVVMVIGIVLGVLGAQDMFQE